MSDNQVSNVGRVEMDYGSARMLQPEPAPAQNTAAKSQPASEEAAAVSATQQHAAAKEGAKAEKPANNPNDFSIKFRIDAKTHDVTVFILDRASNKVVRSIPPEEMQKLNPGELLELFA